MTNNDANTNNVEVSKIADHPEPLGTAYIEVVAVPAKSESEDDVPQAKVPHKHEATIARLRNFLENSTRQMTMCLENQQRHDKESRRCGKQIEELIEEIAGLGRSIAALQADK